MQLKNVGDERSMIDPQIWGTGRLANRGALFMKGWDLDKEL
jgi:hypothetical protein